MGWDLAFAATATYAKPEQFETFRRHIDTAWIEEALAASGTATVRRRRLPVEEVAEPFLVRAGLLARTPRGRVATPAAWQHLGLDPPEPPGLALPGSLFE